MSPWLCEAHSVTEQHVLIGSILLLLELDKGANPSF